MSICIQVSDFLDTRVSRNWRYFDRTPSIKMCSMRDNNARGTIAGESIDRRRSIRNRGQRRCLLSLADFHSRGVPHVRVRAVTAGITMHDVTLGSNPPYLLRATMLQESETLANQVTPTSYSRRSAAMPIDERSLLTPV